MCSIAGVKYGCGVGETPPVEAAQYREANFNFYDRQEIYSLHCNHGCAKYMPLYLGGLKDASQWLLSTKNFPCSIFMSVNNVY